MSAIIQPEPSAEESAAAAKLEAERRSLDLEFPFTVEEFDPALFG